MYARLLILFALIFTNALELLSQSNVIKLDLFGSIITTALEGMPAPKLSYERALGNSFSCQMSLEYGKYEKTLSGHVNQTLSEVYNVHGIGIMPEVRFYPFTKKKKSPMGLFVSAHYRYYSLTEHYFGGSDDIKNKGKVNNLGFNIGFKHGGRLIVAEYIIGPGFSSGDWNKLEANQEPLSEYEESDLSYFATIRFEVNIGFRFPQNK